MNTNIIIKIKGLKHAARGAHVARQMSLCGPRASQKVRKL